jgi:hypothetical protein
VRGDHETSRTLFDMTFLQSQRRRRALLLFSALFVLAVLTQLAVGWYERLATARAELRDTADQIRQELRYSTGWDLVRFRQSDVGSGSYYIVDKRGLVIDIEGFAADLGFQANVDQVPGFQTIPVPRRRKSGGSWSFQ